MTVDPERLVSLGLFPENIPPVFTTKHIWKAINPSQTAYAISSKAIGELATYNASKRGGQRRGFSIPHPLFVKDQGLFLRRHWQVIADLVEAAPGSASMLHLDKHGPRHVRIAPHKELPKIRLRKLSRFKFCLVTDVSRFYELNVHARASLGDKWKG